jgi:ethanolamine utilization microcompartment shell protein EutS
MADVHPLTLRRLTGSITSASAVIANRGTARVFGNLSPPDADCLKGTLVITTSVAAVEKSVEKQVKLLTNKSRMWKLRQNQ